MRFRIGLLCLALAASSQASFDLMIAHDTTSNKFHRYDPTTGAYLGAFNHLGFNTLDKMIADSSTGIVHALSGNQVYRYNYSTGQYLGYQTIGTLINDFVLSPDHTRYYGVTNTASVTNALVGGVGWTTLTGTLANSPSNALWYGDKLVTSNLATKSYTLSSITGTTISQVYNGANMNASATSLKNMVVVESTSGTSHLVQPIGGAVCAYPFITSTSLSGTTSVNFAGFQFANILSLAAGHAGYFYMTGTTSGGTLHTMMISENNYGGVDFNMPQITSFDQMAVAIAPEPGTWAALGLGAFALLRRKR